MIRALLFLALVGCTQQPDDAQPIKVVFVENTAEVRAKCGESFLEPYGCAKQHRSEINHGGACEIVAIRPRGFDDHQAIETLGHELYHCLTGPVHK